MIYFITNKQHNIINSPDNEQIIIVDGIKEFGDFLINKVKKGETDIGYDLETTGLDAYKNEVLLVVIGDKDTKFIFDYTDSDNISSALGNFNNDFTFLGHNLKFDWKFTKTKLRVELKKLYDTMIVEQRLYPNYGLSNGLADVVTRYLQIQPKEMDKSIRMEFVGVNPKTFIFQTKHILYAAKDIEYLFEIKRIQESLIKKWNMEFLIQMEMNLIKVLAESELEGFILNKEKWTKIITENETTKFEKEVALDNEIRRLREELPKEKRIWLVGGKFDRLRNRHPKQINEGLFGEPVTMKALTGTDKKPKDNLGNFNYGSANQIIDLFARLHQPLPTVHDKYLIPKILPNGKIEEGIFTTGEGAVENYLIDNPASEMKTFIKTLIDFREVTTQLNTFGQSFLDYINPITKKIHTIYRQCVAVNGRLQSGNTEESYINIQNIPAQKKFRESFGVAEGYSVVTIDLEGAEVTVMADKANDTKLFELAMKGDIHSHMAQKGWRNIYNYRAKLVTQFNMNFDDIEYGKPTKEWLELVTLSRDFTVSKTVNNETHRKPCKNLTFGGIYGCHAKKAGRTLNISKDEGQIYINTLKSEVPLTFKMVENNVNIALDKGYLILNTRTNSRIWFPKVIHSIRTKTTLDFMDKIEVDGQARNIPISGTQADMLKEAMVEIYNYVKENRLDIILLAQVHDELVYKIKDEYLLYPIKFYEDNSNEFTMEFVPDWIKKTIIKVANRYLKNIKMGASMEVKKTWTK